MAATAIRSRVEIYAQNPCIVRACCGRYKLEKLLPVDIAITDVWNTFDHDNTSMMGTFRNCVTDERAILAEKGPYKPEKLARFAREYNKSHERHGLSGLFGTYVLKEGMNELGLVRIETQETKRFISGRDHNGEEEAWIGNMKKSVAVLTIDLFKKSNTPDVFEGALKLSILVFGYFRSMGLEKKCTSVVYLFELADNPWEDYGRKHALEKFGWVDTMQLYIQMYPLATKSVYKRSFSESHELVGNRAKRPSILLGNQ